MLGRGTQTIDPRHGQELPHAPASTPPVPESRGREGGWWGNEGADRHSLFRGPPAPSLAGKNAPRAGEGASGRGGPGPAAPESEGGSAMLGDARGRSRPPWVSLRRIGKILLGRLPIRLSQR